MAANNYIEKIFSLFSFRVMATWFAKYITNKFDVALTTANNSINATKELALSAIDDAKTQDIQDINSVKTLATTDINDIKNAAALTISLAKDLALAAVSIVNTGSATNVEEIYTYFSNNPGVTSTTVTQLWPGDAEAVLHTVYNYVMYV